MACLFHCWRRLNMNWRSGISSKNRNVKPLQNHHVFSDCQKCILLDNSQSKFYWLSDRVSAATFQAPQMTKKRIRKFHILVISSAWQVTAVALWVILVLKLSVCLVFVVLTNHASLTESLGTQIMVVLMFRPGSPFEGLGGLVREEAYRII